MESCPPFVREQLGPTGGESIKDYLVSSDSVSQNVSQWHVHAGFPKPPAPSSFLCRPGAVSQLLELPLQTMGLFA